MTDAQMLTCVQTLAGDTGNYVQTYIDLAKAIVVGRLFPYDPSKTWEDVPAKHHMRTCEIAAYLVNKRGAEGETQHTESGVARQYASASVPAAMFEGMVPFAGIPWGQ